MPYGWTKTLVLAVAGLCLAQGATAQTAAENLKTGHDFLAKMARQPGVVVLPTGVMYRVISRASNPGDKPTVADTVTIDYEGKLINGSVFDSSYARRAPATFPLGALVPAWKQAIPQMHVGDEIILYTPPSQAYGERDLSPDIPSNSTLIFRVHLIGIDERK
jgi:FKBP-type peptidyl-prolyl cis-trans isomerase